MTRHVRILALTSAVILALALALFAAVAHFRSDTQHFEYPLFDDLSRQDPITAGWFPPAFPKSSRDIKGAIHIDSNSFWAVFSIAESERERLLSGASRVSAAQTGELRSVASQLSDEFGPKDDISFYRFDFVHAQSGSSVRANLAMNMRKNRSLLWYSLSKVNS